MVGGVLLDRPICRRVCFEGLPTLVCWIYSFSGTPLAVYFLGGLNRRGREVEEEGDVGGFTGRRA